MRGEKFEQGDLINTNGANTNGKSLSNKKGGLTNSKTWEI
jgi:uncharacterized protein (DUF927 family)